MKLEIIVVLRELHEHAYYDWRLNTIFVTLIAKKEGGKEIEDYQPYSMLLGIYKLVGKTLVIRLKWVFPTIVPENNVVESTGDKPMEKS